MTSKWTRSVLNVRSWLISSPKLMHSVSEELSKTRNIALLAHVDAGKTTTTERMLFYSGKITSMGEVHHGNTVTDFMELERNRGITIASAFVTFYWNKHILNLVDTPGHIDFTMEVEQSLKIIDGAVVVLDGSAGVEAQTLTVWQQLIRKGLPALFYVNKMDRIDADFNYCLSTLEKKLMLLPLPIHLPVKGETFHGHINVVTMEEILWSKNPDDCSKNKLSDSHELYIEALSTRTDLVDCLSTLDDVLADIVLECGSLEAVETDDIMAAIRRVTIARKAFPVICGSSYKNVGIESLLDSIIDFLPSPKDSSEVYFNEFGGSALIARCFKIRHDKQRGRISFFRIYNGKLSKGQKIYNISQNKTDSIGKILKVFADELQEISSEKYGNFVAVTGLKEIVSGDLICDTAYNAKNLKKKLASKFNLSEDLVSRNIFQNNEIIPEPVFFCSVEPPSQRWQSELDKALQEIQKEDPSLRVNFDSEGGQTILAGMGELHLEIVKEKLISFYGIDVDMGPLQIIYKEELLYPSKETFILQNPAASQDYSVSVTISLIKGEQKDILSLDTSGDSAENLAQCNQKQISAIKTGIISALNHGPLFSCQVINVHAILHRLEARKTTPEPLLIAAASHCVTKILEKNKTQLLEPVMLLHITVDKLHLKTVLGDLSKRRAIILNVENTTKIPEIYCEAPLAELLGYAKCLRTNTSGTATFNMEFSAYRMMSPREQSIVLKNNC